jgi:SHS2 domain-containing protein
MAHQIYPSLKTYEFIEHTADICIRVRGSDLKSIFKNTALAMFDIIATKQKRGILPQKTLTLKQQAANKEELLLCWLNELLSLSAIKGLIFKTFTIKKIDEQHLEAAAKGEDISSYKVETEVKAATFNGLVLKKTRSGWLVKVVFDV